MHMCQALMKKLRIVTRNINLQEVVIEIGTGSPELIVEIVSIPCTVCPHYVYFINARSQHVHVHTGISIILYNYNTYIVYVWLSYDFAHKVYILLYEQNNSLFMQFSKLLTYRFAYSGKTYLFVATFGD